MNRREFAKGCVATASAMAMGQVCAQTHAPTGDPDLDLRQDEIDAIAPQDFKAYWTPGTQLPDDQLAEQVARFPVLGRLEAAFDKVFREAKETVVAVPTAVT